MNYYLENKNEIHDFEKMCQNQRFYILKNGLTLTVLERNRKLYGNKSDFKVSKNLFNVSKPVKIQLNRIFRILEGKLKP